jgi:LuxR family transcriptional regulator, regulator of acetate metabolism
LETVRALSCRVEAVITELRESRCEAVLDHAFISPAARDHLDEVNAAVTGALCESPDSVALLQVLVDIARERREMDQHDAAERERVEITVGTAIDRLRGLETSGEMSRRAPAELREACGFTRVMISSARGSRWMPDTMRPTDHADPDAVEFARFAQSDNEIPLAHLLPETQMVRHRVPVIVSETSPHAYKPLVHVTKTTAYVAAPIVTTRRVIGFFHADRIGQSGKVTPGDRDSTALFAGQFAVLFENAVLAERAQQQRARWAAGLLAIVDGLDTLTVTYPPLTWVHAGGSAVSRSHNESEPSKPSRALTQRERQVMSLLAGGATNQVIAQELVLSVDTVKTHVKNIMGKLQVTSRAGAVAKHLRSLHRDGGAS